MRIIVVLAELGLSLGKAVGHILLMVTVMLISVSSLALNESRRAHVRLLVKELKGLASTSGTSGLPTNDRGSRACPVYRACSHRREQSG